jgi:superfamily II DNA or RNA helicase
VEVQESRGARIGDVGGLLRAVRLVAIGDPRAQLRYRRSGQHGQAPFRQPDAAVLQLLARYGRRSAGGALVTIEEERAPEVLHLLLAADDVRGLLGGPLAATSEPPKLQLRIEPGRGNRIILRTLWLLPSVDLTTRGGGELPVLAFRGDQGAVLLAGDQIGEVAPATVALSREIPAGGREFPAEEVVRRLQGISGRPLPPGVSLWAPRAGAHRVGGDAKVDGGAAAPVEALLQLERHGEQVVAVLRFEYRGVRVPPAPEILAFAARYVVASGVTPRPSSSDRGQFLAQMPTRFGRRRRRDHTEWLRRDNAAELDQVIELVTAGLIRGASERARCSEAVAVAIAAAVSSNERWHGCRVDNPAALAGYEPTTDPVAVELRVLPGLPSSAGLAGAGTAASAGAGWRGSGSGGGALGGGWFEMELEARVGEDAIDPALMLQLLASGKEYVPTADGRRARIPAAALRQLHGLLETAGAEAGAGLHFRARRATLGLFHDATREGVTLRFDDPQLRALAAGLAESGTGLGEDQGRKATTLPKTSPPKGLRATLRDYQLEGFRWLEFLAANGLGGILADDMGLGKTIQALCLLQHLREQQGAAPNLVIAPSSVVLGWAEEAGRFTPELRVLVLSGPRRWQGAPDLSAHDLVVTSYALLRRDTEQLAAIDWRVVIFDEAQFLKNLATRSATAARALRAGARFALSGTPVENRLRELYALYDLVQPGLLGSEGEFDTDFESPINSGGEVGAQATSRLHRRIRPYLLRRLKADVVAELPPRTEVELPIELLPGQARLYREVLHTIRGDVLQRVERDGMGRSTIHVLAALTRLRQVACDPRLLGKEVPAALRGSAKLEVLKGMLPELVAEGHAALIFSQFTRFLDHLEEMLRDLGLEWVRLDGSTPTHKRAERVKHFQSETGPPLFLISLKAGGTGLNLTRADYVFHLDPWWNPAVEDQATDRAHRIGQSRPVVAYRLVAAGTVESRIRQLQERKRDLAAAVLGGDTGLAAKLGQKELELLLS